MAPRVVKIRHDEETRAKIRVSQLLNRLMKHGFGKLELSPTQVRAIEIVLKKALPDLAHTVIAGDADAPLTTQRIERVIVKAPGGDEQARAAFERAADHAPPMQHECDMKAKH